MILAVPYFKVHNIYFNLSQVLTVSAQKSQEKLGMYTKI